MKKNLLMILLMFAMSIQAKLQITVHNTSDKPIIAAFSNKNCKVKNYTQMEKALGLSAEKKALNTFVKGIEAKESNPCGIAEIDPNQSKTITTSLTSDSWLIRGVSVHIADQYGTYLLSNKASGVTKGSSITWNGKQLLDQNKKVIATIRADYKAPAPLKEVTRPLKKTTPAAPSGPAPMLPMEAKMKNFIDNNIKPNKNITFKLINEYYDLLDEFEAINYGKTPQQAKHKIKQVLYSYWYRRAVLQKYIDIYKANQAAWLAKLNDEMKEAGEEAITEKMAQFAFKNALSQYTTELQTLEVQNNAPKDARSKLNEFVNSRLNQVLEGKKLQ